MPCNRSVALLGLCAALLALSLARPAAAVSSYATLVEASIAIGGGAVPLLEFRDLIETPQIDNHAVVFPSFVTNDWSSGWDPVTHTLSLSAASNGAANYSGAVDPAFATGMTRLSATIGVVNPTALGLFLDVTLFGGFEYAGFANDHMIEGAESLFALSFMGDILSGLPPDNLAFVDQATWDFIPPSDFDLVTSTDFLAIEDHYSVLIPPSDTEIAPGVINRRIWSLGLFIQAGGSAISRGDGLLIVDEIPPGVPIIPPSEFVPEPGPLGLGLAALACAALRHGARFRASSGRRPAQPSDSRRSRLA